MLELTLFFLAVFLLGPVALVSVYFAGKLWWDICLGIVTALRKLKA